MVSTLASVSSLQGVPLTYLGALFVQTVLATVMFALLGIVYYQRRSLPYLFVWLAGSTLLVESLIGVVGLHTAISPMAYVVIDHGLDILLLASMLGAVYFARRIRRPNGTHERV